MRHLNTYLLITIKDVDLGTLLLNILPTLTSYLMLLYSLQPTVLISVPLKHNHQCPYLEQLLVDVEIYDVPCRYYIIYSHGFRRDPAVMGGK